MATTPSTICETGTVYERQPPKSLTTKGLGGAERRKSLISSRLHRLERRKSLIVNGIRKHNWTIWPYLVSIHRPASLEHKKHKLTI